jgi:hypothetical protein
MEASSTAERQPMSIFYLRWGPTPSDYHGSLSLAALFRNT